MMTSSLSQGGHLSLNVPLGSFLVVGFRLLSKGHLNAEPVHEVPISETWRNGRFCTRFGDLGGWSGRFDALENDASDCGPPGPWSHRRLRMPSRCA